MTHASDTTVDRARLLAEIGSVAAAIDETNARRAELYRRRAALFRVGRSLDPPITNPDLGAAAGVSEVAVIQALRAGNGGR